MRKLTKVLAIIWCSVFLSSCVKDFKNIDSVEVDNWQPEVAIPLVNTTVSIQDVLDDFETGGYLNVDDDNFMKVVYSSELLSVTGEEMVSIPDFTIPMIQPEMTIPTSIINLPFDIDYFIAKKGKLNYSFSSNYQEDIDVVIQVKNLTKSGVVLEIPTEVSSTAAAPAEISGSADLEDYVMLFATGEIEVSYMATNQAGEERIFPDMLLEFTEFEYSFVQGYFGQYAFELPREKIIIDLFKNSISGNIRVEDPKINLNVTNSFGLPIRIGSEVMTATTLHGGDIEIVTPLTTGFDFNYPALSEVGENKMSQISINNSTSNIADVIENSPQEINFELGAISNPNADPSERGFVLDDSQFDVNLEIEIPVWLSASNFKISNTTEFDASFFEEIESAEFKLGVENGLPVEAGVQVYFEDALGVVMDSLFQNTNNIFVAAEVGPDGKVTTVSKSEQTIAIEGNRLENFRNATQITITGLASTTNAGNTAVKFFSDYTMKFQLGAKAKVSN